VIVPVVDPDTAAFNAVLRFAARRNRFDPDAASTIVEAPPSPVTDFGPGVRQDQPDPDGADMNKILREAGRFPGWY
jgi:hypothetical protein